MKDPLQSMQRELETCRLRMLELDKKLAELPADFGPEILTFYGNLLAKERTFQSRMALALASPPPKNVSKFRVTLAAVLLKYFFTGWSSCNSCGHGQQIHKFHSRFKSHH
jgi:hypothetical protein